MSRSYKRTPYAGDTPSKNMKRYANKRIRQLLKDRDIAINNREYKKWFPSWDIRDYKEIAPSFEEFYQRQVARFYSPYWYHKGSHEPTKEECKKLYNKYYKRK